MATATPYFLFDGECAQAMQFYYTVFGGELHAVTVGESPMRAQFPPEMHQKVVNAHLKSGGIELSASDWLMPTEKRVVGNTTCAYISNLPYAELARYFEKLAPGAEQKTLHEPQSRPFGTYAALTDKYGVRWMFQGDAQES